MCCHCSQALESSSATALSRAEYSIALDVMRKEVEERLASSRGEAARQLEALQVSCIQAHVGSYRNSKAFAATHHRSSFEALVDFAHANVAHHC